MFYLILALDYFAIGVDWLLERAEEFVYLGFLVHTTTQISPDILCPNAIIRVAMQNLGNQIWKSRISIFTILKLYNTCILPILLSAG